MPLEYLLAFQVFCGGFAAHLAAKQGSSRAVWFVVGMALPIAGVLLALVVARGPGASTGRVSPGLGARGKAGPSQGRRRPKRCSGSYIADCQGCPYFRSRPLFDSSPEDAPKGHCHYFRKALSEENGSKPEHVVAEGE
ncbi:MAG: hypothetical protein QGI33_01420 [Candidatus Brocadiia bacterium]|jgi:hypothetical protein|nr:hypothetical protein [Candidatus Brocadiia bacterium]